MKTLKNLCMLLMSIAFIASMMTAIQSCSKEDGSGGGGTPQLTLSIEARADGAILTCTMDKEYNNMLKTFVIGGGDLQENLVIVASSQKEVQKYSYTSDTRKKALLTPNTQYWCKAYIHNNTDGIMSEQYQFKTAELAKLTIEIVDITSNTITVKAKSDKKHLFRSIHYCDGAGILERFKKGGTSNQQICIDTEPSGDSIIATFEGLELNMTCYFIADFHDDVMSVYSEEISATTNDKHPLYFPDDNFRNFVVQKYGSGGTITEGQAKAVSNLDLNEIGIRDLTGLEYFTNIKSLNLNRNLMDTVDLNLSNYHKLDTVTCNNCQNLEYMKICNGSIKIITACNNPKLKKGTFLLYDTQILTFTDNNAEELLLNTDKETNSRYIKVNCKNNRLVSFKLNENTWCEQLDISNNNLRYLSLEKNGWTSMGLLHCQNNPNLTEVIVKNEQFAKNINDLEMDPQTKFVWPE